MYQIILLLFEIGKENFFSSFSFSRIEMEEEKLEIINIIENESGYRTLTINKLVPSTSTDYLAFVCRNELNLFLFFLYKIPPLFFFHLCATIIVFVVDNRTLNWCLIRLCTQKPLCLLEAPFFSIHSAYYLLKII